MTAERIIAAVQKRGNDATDLRDAAHEAHHALTYKVRSGKWDRETIHRAITKRRQPGEWVAAELDARAVEQVVCARLGVDCGGIEKWAAICWFETLKGVGINLPSPEWIAERVKERMKLKRIAAAADAVIGLRIPRARAVR